MSSIEKLENIIANNLENFTLSKGRKTLQCGHLSVYPFEDQKTLKIYAEFPKAPKINTWSNNEELYDRVQDQIRTLNDAFVQELIEIAEEEIYQKTKE